MSRDPVPLRLSAMSCHIPGHFFSVFKDSVGGGGGGGGGVVQWPVNSLLCVWILS